MYTYNLLLLIYHFKLLFLDMLWYMEDLVYNEVQLYVVI